MNAKSRPPKKDGRETTRAREAGARAEGAPVGFRDGFRPGDPEILLRLNEAQLPRAAICALGMSLPAWRDLETPAQVVDAIRPLEVSRKQAARALRLLGSAQQTLPDPRQRELTQGLAPVARHAAGLETAVTTCAETNYPEALLDLPLPPPILFHRGELPATPGIAIVGSRRADRYGRDVAARFARELAERGLPIVSGFARGIDQTAHQGALAASGGRTVAVLGCGLDIDYPSGCHELAAEIARRGATVSEFPLGTRPMRQNFPIRNRIIAALTLGTLVVQGTERSGSLITARLAIDLGRDVYAVPGRITDDLSSGTNRLIRDGAHPALSAEAIVDTLPIVLQTILLDPPSASKGWSNSEQPAAPSSPPPPTHLAATYRALETSPTPLDSLAMRLGVPMDRLLASLLELEIGGWIERTPGPAVRRTS